MRIAYVCADPGVPVFGRKGASIHVQEILRAFVRQGAAVELFAACLGGLPGPDLRAVRVRELAIPDTGDAAVREQARLAANNVFRLALAGAGPFDMVYERYALWSSAGMAYAREERVPGVLEVNAPLIDEQADYRVLIDRIGAKAVEMTVFSSASVVVAVSQEVAAYVRRVAGARERVHVLPNGVDPDRFHPAVPPSRPAVAFTVGFVGGHRPWHDLPTLVEAVARLCEDRGGDTRLLIVGEGPKLEHLARIAAARGLSEVMECTGGVPPEAVPGLLTSMDVAVAPYPDLPHFYFSPLKVFEYMAAGRAVVASGIGQLCEVIRDGENGVLYPPGDAGALAHTLRQLKHDAVLRRRLGGAARSTVIRSHTWAVRGARILQLAGLAPAPPSAAAGVMPS